MSWVYNYAEQVQHLKELRMLLLNTGCIKKLHLSFGTFLGAFRQGALNTKYTSTWDDLDFAFISQDLEDMLEKVFPGLEELGWKTSAAWWNPNGDLSQVTFIKGLDRLDINQMFYASPMQDYYVHWIQAGPQILKKGLRKTFYTDLATYNVDGVAFYGPKDGESYCKDMYGDNWSIPCNSETAYDYTSDSPGLPWWDRITFEKTTGNWRK